MYAFRNRRVWQIVMQPLVLIFTICDEKLPQQLPIRPAPVMAQTQHIQTDNSEHTKQGGQQPQNKYCIQSKTQTG